ncbi:hypothetical protein [Streptomyces sp. NPDC006668]|uniref:hypothetical protein n=1 Tax=Streptomyces sp. NPDC006668 TaxID=3156903 RepID=UPI0033CE48DD
MDDEPTPVVLTATCHSQGCPSAEVPIQAAFYPNANDPIFRAECAGCEQAVTDLVPFTSLPNPAA